MDYINELSEVLSLIEGGQVKQAIASITSMIDEIILASLEDNENNPYDYDIYFPA